MLQLGQDGGPIPGTTRRAERSLIVGILLSVTLHALAILLLLAAMTTEQGGRTPIAARAAPEVTMVFLTAPSGESVSRLHSSPDPVTRSDAQALAPVTGRSRMMALATAAPVASTASVAPASGGALVTAATPSPTVYPVLGEDYRRRLQAHIAGYRGPPDRPVGGLVQVQLAIGRDGDVLAVAVASSSGIAELDDEAVATIWRARPMPPIPQALPSRLVVTLPISFDAKRVAARQESRP